MTQTWKNLTASWSPSWLQRANWCFIFRLKALVVVTRAYNGNRLNQQKIKWSNLVKRNINESLIQNMNDIDVYTLALKEGNYPGKAKNRT